MFTHGGQRKNIAESGTWVRGLFLTILALSVLLQLCSFITSPREQLINLFDDDANYYFEIARNFTQT